MTTVVAHPDVAVRGVERVCGEGSLGVSRVFGLPQQLVPIVDRSKCGQAAKF